MNLKIRTVLLWTALFATPAVVAYFVDLQGFNLLDDGLWVLGTRVIADGGMLYRDFFTVYGPAKFYILLPFFWILGESVHSLVVFKAVVAGGSSILGFFVTRRYGAKHMAWLVPISVLAIGSIPPRYIFATVFAVTYAEILSRSSRLFANGLILGLAWGALSLFGLDMLASGTIIVFAGAAFTHLLTPSAPSFPVQRLFGVIVGLVGVLAISLLVAVSTGTLSSFVWDTIACPLTFAPRHIGLNFLEGFFRPQEISTVFSQVFTGERLAAAWPGHAGLRIVAVRMMTALVFVAPFLVGFVRRKAIDPRVGPLFALALTGWVLLLWRSDVAHVFAAFYGTLLLAVCLLSVARIPRIPATWLGVLFVVVAVAPFAGERLWLLTHADRPSLVQWDRPTAKIAMAKNRHDTIERVIGSFEMGDESPTIGWPAQPGLVFLSGRPLATRQVTLLAGSVRRETSVIDDLRESDPGQLVLGRVAGLAPGARSMDALAPSIWTYLRSNFFIELQVADGAEGFQVIRSAKKSAVDLESLPLERRLPGTSQLVKNSQTPPLTPGVSIGQTLRVGGLDLQGIVLLVATTGTLPVEADMEVEVDEILADGRTQRLALFRTRVPLDERVQLRTLAFPAIPHSAGKMIVLNFSVASNTGNDFRLLWHDPRAAKLDPIDYYPEGHAVLNGKPGDADLFFISY